MESVLLSLWNYVRNQYQKIFKNNPHIFMCNVTLAKRDPQLSHPCIFFFFLNKSILVFMTTRLLLNFCYYENCHNGSF